MTSESDYWFDRDLLRGVSPFQNVDTNKNFNVCDKHLDHGCLIVWDNPFACPICGLIEEHEIEINDLYAQIEKIQYENHQKHLDRK